MATIDRTERARLGAQIRQDTRLTPAARLVALALLFAFMGASGRAWPSYETLASAAGVSVSSAKRAILQLVALGYLSKHRRWGRHPVQRAGRWVPACLSNVYIWLTRLSVKATPESRLNKIKVPEAMPAGVARALERLGHTIADRMGLPQVA